ncbi:hypothetical protein [Lentilactobacillus curieae]|nr:hypothetical protein [Lentilactobacillus curieae]
MKKFKCSTALLFSLALGMAVSQTTFASKAKTVNYDQLSHKQQKLVKFSGAWHYDAKNSPSVYVRVYRNMKIKNGTKQNVKFDFSKIKYYRPNFPKSKANVVFPHKPVVVKPGHSVTIKRAFDVYGQQSLYEPTMKQFYYYQKPQVKIMTNSDLKR